MQATILRSKDIHDKWKSNYRTSENVKFHRMACEVIGKYFGKIDGPVLDAGCGTGVKTICLAGLGYDVIGVDLAEVVLKEAQGKIAEAGYSRRVKVVQADLMHLAFPDKRFGAILVWGVLMHIPNLEKAVSEFCRVLKPGGKIVIYDANPGSLDVRFLTLVKKLANLNGGVKAKMGIENWFESGEGRILVRWTYYAVLQELFKKNGVRLDGRRAGQFTESYVYLPRAFLRTLVHHWNNLYFRFIRWPLPAYANMMFGKKSDANFADRRWSSA